MYQDNRFDSGRFGGGEGGEGEDEASSGLGPCQRGGLRPPGPAGHRPRAREAQPGRRTRMSSRPRPQGLKGFQPQGRGGYPQALPPNFQEAFGNHELGNPRVRIQGLSPGKGLQGKRLKGGGIMEGTPFSGGMVTQLDLEAPVKNHVLKSR